MAFPLFSHMRSSTTLEIISQVEEEARAAGLTVVGLHRFLLDGSVSEEISYDGMHLTPEGHELVGGLLHRRLSSRPGLFAGRGKFSAPPKTPKKKT